MENESKKLNENVNTEAEQTENASVDNKKSKLPLIIGGAVGGVVLVAGIIAAVVLLGGKGNSCDGHVDKDDDLKCDKCSEAFDDGEEAPEIVKEQCSFTVVDSDGQKVAGAEFTLKLGSVNETLTSDANGAASVALAEGKYTVDFNYDSIPSGFQPSVFSVEVKADSTSFELLLVNNNPNGTADRPYYIAENETPLELLADAEVYYNIRGGSGKTLRIECVDVTVTFNGTLYEPVDGVVEIYIESEVDATNVFSVKNTSENDLDIVINLISPPGSMDNPIEMTANTVVAPAPVGSSVWYKWTAPASGVVLVGSSNSRNNISLINQATNAVSETTEGSLGEYMMVSLGDVVLVSVSAMSSRDDESLVCEIEFSVALYAGTESDPIPVVKDSFGLSFRAGAAVTFTTENGGELTISDSDVTVTYNGETKSPSNLGIVKLTLEAGAIFTITNTSDAPNGIEVKIN